MGSPSPLEDAASYADYIKAVEQVREQAAAEHARLLDRMPMWVVFGPGTSDQTGLFVAQLWICLPEPVNTSLLIRADTLQHIRDLLPNGLTLMPRQPDDDANILEIWL
jgi:hypothetical protein